MIATAFVLFCFTWLISDIEFLDPLARVAAFFGIDLLLAGFATFLWGVMP